ncbi:MAG: 16S rRNA (uracil(1498)-N(3))-methyltransferase [Propionibacteriaceae bacterium]|jgi:16S rRNA (uracil1498-N3)-methyltransferase|nr:16S rRNA (uracil(1498)-N(3))-methyltransferase [Propionibacteriaceae bacterium]
MTYPLFLAEFEAPSIGDLIEVTGDEAHHFTVKRIALGEVVTVANGRGTAIIGPLAQVSPPTVRVEQVLTQPATRRYVCVQALPKGDRAELAVAQLTEAGISEIIPWQAERSIVQWKGERAEKGLRRWQAAAREAAKVSRRFTVPQVSELHGTKAVCERIQAAELAFVMHEEATTRLSELTQNPAEVLFVIGPEGGLTDGELAAFTAAGAQPVLLTDGVLRTSTAGLFALAQLQVVLK